MVCTIIISLYLIIIHRMNYKKDIHSLNNLRKEKNTFHIFRQTIQKEKRPPRGFEITFKKIDPNLFTISIISNLQGQSLLRVDKSS